ncbi:MAG: cytochrome C biogenesis protein, partial [Pseudomonadales bacterium]|nr:cytochrome C biogenesis protein [Pseudomonadales bacterium]
MAKFFLPLLLAFAGLLPTGASQAADPFRSAKPASGVLAQPQFLPVGEAYRLRASVQDGRVLLEWDIAPGYYLYRDQFLVKALTGSEARPLAFDLIAGEARRIYDEYYEKELEVFYERVQLRAALPVAAPPPVTLAVTSQGCADAGLCYPPHIQYLEVD